MTTDELPKAYNFKSTEPRIYAMWETGGYFRPSNDPHRPGFDASVKPFVISIPPPNITGELHVGHVLFVSLEDLMIRYHRMKGFPSLWVPGTDHAGISTQIKVERMLEAEGTSREQVGREEFLKQTWAWKQKYGGIISTQVRRIGASCDWERERFTLDDGLSRAVREAFVRLYEKGLIYRGPRLINWSPALKTAVSDLEVEYSEEQATLYYFKYMLKDSDEFIPVATIRPETILGDTAVAVHPEDERYQKYIGKKVIVPMLGREIPVIADDYVSREFGTGALKITPGHDPNDYEIAQRHNLPILSMLDAAAKVTEVGGPYAGLDRFACREKLWADMKAAGLVIKEEPYLTTIPRSERGHEIIEPMISTQWFVKIQPLAEAAIKAVRDGRIRIIPERFEKVYYNWLENIKDWCISRQLWWGHRIPVWYCDDCGEQSCARTDPLLCAHCGGKNIRQDPDVLDTWFSSGLWPFSTLGWPEETPDLKYFYPTTIMETGYDILFFWVARMIMMGLEFTGQAPFHTVYLHGLIRADEGRKMSKSYGTAIDPLTIMDELGTDALRFTLLVGSTPGNDQTTPGYKKIESNRNFVNKIWNVGRFVMSAISTLTTDDRRPTTDEWTLADSWIWARLQQLVRDVERLFQVYQYGEAGRQIYDFFWSDFADWYVEVAKLQLQKEETKSQTAATLVRVLDISLRLLHPFIPFVTEELWGHLRRAVGQNSILSSLGADWPEALIVAPWPEPRPEEGWEEEKITDFDLVRNIHREVRNIRAQKKVSPHTLLSGTFLAGEKTELLENMIGGTAVLSGLNPDELTFIHPYEYQPSEHDWTNHIPIVVSGVTGYFSAEEMKTSPEEMSRLQKELADTEAQIARLEKLLASDFAHKAPAPIVQKEREKLAAYKETAAKLKSQLDSLK